WRELNIRYFSFTELSMSIKVIKEFSEKAKVDEVLKEKLKECQKLKDLLALGKEYGYEIDEVSLYPPNEPQFVEEQLSEKLVKALLRV
ncbi:MAG: Nif11-like leader peptide family natural product precursor, partial [Methylobacter sp.]